MDQGRSGAVIGAGYDARCSDWSRVLCIDDSGGRLANQQLKAPPPGSTVLYSIFVINV